MKQYSNQDIINQFIEAKAILDGHFILSSGLHSDRYIQCAKLLSDPQRSSLICSLLAEKIRQNFQPSSFDIILSPAMGGVVVGYEMARQLGLQAIFCERVDGLFKLRRGFELLPKQKVLVVEDVITTGKSSLETFKIAQEFGAEVVAEACLIDRSNDKEISKKLNVPIISLLNLEIKSFDSNQIPPYLESIPAVKPGSRTKIPDTTSATGTK
jgi:orotate phosphoribosyltransferase